MRANRWSVAELLRSISLLKTLCRTQLSAVPMGRWIFSFILCPDIMAFPHGTARCWKLKGLNGAERGRGSAHVICLRKRRAICVVSQFLLKMGVESLSKRSKAINNSGLYLQWRNILYSLRAMYKKCICSSLNMWGSAMSTGAVRTPWLKRGAKFTIRLWKPFGSFNVAHVLKMVYTT